MGAEWPHGDLCWHVSPSLNRASILEHGLDWRRMVALGGIATGSAPTAAFRHRPEAAAVFLCGSLEEAEWFATLSDHPLVDIWQVDVRGLLLEDGPDGWLIHREPIAASRVGLARSDITPSPDEPPQPGDVVDSPDANHLSFRVTRKHDSPDGSTG
jgi:hypothetical protein